MMPGAGRGQGQRAGRGDHDRHSGAPFFLGRHASPQSHNRPSV
jgi:hypothetical protein